jgi:Gly-Xaa carboxypeptidase
MQTDIVSINTLAVTRRFHTQMSSSTKKKEGAILPSSSPSPIPLPKRKNGIWVVIICFIIIFRSTYLHFWHPTDKSSWTPSNNCPQADILIPEKNGQVWSELNVKIGSAAFKQTAIDWLAGAVQIP